MGGRSVCGEDTDTEGTSFKGDNALPPPRADFATTNGESWPVVSKDDDAPPGLLWASSDKSGDFGVNGEEGVLVAVARMVGDGAAGTSFAGLSLRASRGRIVIQKMQ